MRTHTIIGVIAAAATTSAASTTNTINANDADAHGCALSAGYHWCELEAKCIMPISAGSRLTSEQALIKFQKQCDVPRKGGLATAAATNPSFGGDVDAHGCSIAAGMRWCARQGQCVRPFTSGFKSEQDFEATCDGGQGGHADRQGCYSEAGYQWCAALRRCVRPWEEGLHTASATTAACEHGILPVAAATTAAAATAATGKALRGSSSSSSSSGGAVVGGDVDSHGCVLSAGMHWCAKQGQCIVPGVSGFASEKAFEGACNGAIGGSGDEQGCFTQAGFQWCPAVKKCVRPWEELGGPDCGFRSLTVGSDVDSHGCLLSENNHWCEKQGRCTKPWVCTPLTVVLTTQ